MSKMWCYLFTEYEYKEAKLTRLLINLTNFICFFIPEKFLGKEMAKMHIKQNRNAPPTVIFTECKEDEQCSK